VFALHVSNPAEQVVEKATFAVEPIVTRSTRSLADSRARADEITEQQTKTRMRRRPAWRVSPEQVSMTPLSTGASGQSQLPYSYAAS